MRGGRGHNISIDLSLLFVILVFSIWPRTPKKQATLHCVRGSDLIVTHYADECSSLLETINNM